VEDEGTRWIALIGLHRNKMQGWEVEELALEIASTDGFQH
jgi:hypothetical protein